MDKPGGESHDPNEPQDEAAWRGLSFVEICAREIPTTNVFASILAHHSGPVWLVKPSSVENLHLVILCQLCLEHSAVGRTATSHP